MAKIKIEKPLEYDGKGDTDAQKECFSLKGRVSLKSDSLECIARFAIVESIYSQWSKIFQFFIKPAL